MEKFINFIDILAWVMAIISTGFVAARIIVSCSYSKIEKLRDKMNGIRASFPIYREGIIAIICWSWIITGWLL